MIRILLHLLSCKVAAVVCGGNSEMHLCCMCFSEKVEAKVRQLFDIAVSREIRLWMKFSGNTLERLEQGKSLQEAGAYRGMVSWCAFSLLLEL